MKPHEAFRVLERVQESKRRALRDVLTTKPVCVHCLNLQKDALETEVDALNVAMECLRGGLAR